MAPLPGAAHPDADLPPEVVDPAEGRNPPGERDDPAAGLGQLLDLLLVGVVVVLRVPVDGQRRSSSDVSAAAGTSDVLESVNESFAIYSQSGTQQYTSTLQNWFKRTASTSVFDPHVIIDPRGSRYAMVADDGTNWLLSVAQQSSGTGNCATHAARHQRLRAVR
ncbi:hypothetical protein N8I84_01195 [Streptomyces cynarae]|uniref:Uncharacterized protein n=1 Tax=Streptomyces cynarae TaxID=2981134 RepID=A0ABY6DT37_9ACTN|nr:hypothetical protein [Streptomyces cynarae]UXY17530.1 hypothetical protein N8I84_01195 [Streptomyces cynarae]